MYEQFLFPKGIVTQTGIDNVTAETIFAAGTRVKITHILITNETGTAGAANLRTIADATIFPVSVPAFDTVVLPGWDLDTAGLEVVGVTAAVTFSVTAFYLVF